MPRLKRLETGFTKHAVDWRYGAKDVERIRWGFLPQDMNEKWIAYFDGEEVHAHRSWTGMHLYSLKVTTSGIDRVMARQGLGLDLARWFVEVLLIGRVDPAVAEFRKLAASARRLERRRRSRRQDEKPDSAV